jgi:hypothetical protein
MYHRTLIDMPSFSSATPTIWRGRFKTWRAIRRWRRSFGGGRRSGYARRIPGKKITEQYEELFLQLAAGEDPTRVHLSVRLINSEEPESTAAAA